MNTFGKHLEDKILQHAETFSDDHWKPVAIGTLNEVWTLAGENKVYQNWKRDFAAKIVLRAPILPALKLDGAEWQDAGKGGYVGGDKNLPAGLFVLLDREDGDYKDMLNEEG
jgi:hypothetical protein